ncbi:MAG: hypothetical protein E6Q36_08925 [Chryseobacterium sp.]|nr:MAG: hypothetical protein E6Q36_08925 [Chryseobacterium sp.]
MMKGKKYLAEFVTGMLYAGKLNFLRYHVTMSLMDERGEGRVVAQEAYQTLAANLGINVRTVRRTLKEMAKYEWLSITDTHIYLKKQEKIALRYDVNLSSRRAVVFTPEDITGDIVHWRSQIADAILAVHGDNPTITREKLHELYGWSRQTQRKYNREANTSIRENLAVLSEKHSEYDLQRAQQVRPHAFSLTDHNGVLSDEPKTQYVVAQIANTYKPQHTKVKRRIRALCNKQNGQRQLRKRVFIDQDPTTAKTSNDGVALKAWGKDTERDMFYYRKTSQGVGLWGRIAPKEVSFF